MAEFAVSATVLKQRGQELYCFAMGSAQLRKICYVTPRSEDDPEEIQRILKPARARAIGEYIKEDDSLLPSALVVSLTDEVRVDASGVDNVKVLVFPDVEGHFAYILDGQHRLAGFDYSDGIQFDLPVVALYNAPIAMRGKVFADINSKQERVTDVQLLEIYYQIGGLPQDDARVVSVVHMLANDPDSPLHGKIKVLDTDKGAWVKNVALKRWLAPHLTVGGALSSKTTAQQARIVKDYLRAVSELWPDAWGNLGDYMLSRFFGLEVMLGIFAQVKTRCDLNCGREYSVGSFLSQMQPIKSASIKLPAPAGDIPLDWLRSTMAIISNTPGRRLIVHQLADILQRADEPA